MEQHQRAVHHADIFHAVAVHVKIKIVLGFLNLGVLVAEQGLCGNDGVTRPDLADDGDPVFPVCFASGDFSDQFFQGDPEIVRYAPEFVQLGRGTPVFPVGKGGSGDAGRLSHPVNGGLVDF